MAAAEARGANVALLPSVKHRKLPGDVKSKEGRRSNTVTPGQCSIAQHQNQPLGPVCSFPIGKAREEKVYKLFNDSVIALLDVNRGLFASWISNRPVFVLTCRNGIFGRSKQIRAKPSIEEYWTTTVITTVEDSWISSH